MKKNKKIITAACIAAIVLLLGAFIYTVYFMPNNYDATNQYSTQFNGYSVAYGADGSGGVEVKEFRHKRKQMTALQFDADKKADAIPGLSNTEDNESEQEDSGSSFFMWMIDGEYEIIGGNINNVTIRIVPKSDLRVMAVYQDGENTSEARYQIIFRSLNEGFLETLKLFVIALVGAIPLGLILSFGSMSRFKPLSYLVRFIIWIERGSPLMLQLLIIYYAPGLLFGPQYDIWGQGESGRFVASCVAFVVNYACYFSEIFRGGIQGVPIGQHEAGQVLGLTKRQIFFKITLMQMIKRIMPPMSNEIITLVKDTSLSRIINFQEIIWAGYAFSKSSHGIHGIIWPLFMTGVYYLLFSGLLTLLFGKIEKKLSYFKV